MSAIPMPIPAHRIHRLRWIVSTDSAVEAFTLRQRLRDQWQDLLLSAFEKVFDEAATGEDVIHIPKLELCMTVSAEEDLIQVLPDLIRQQLQESLQNLPVGQVTEQVRGDRAPLAWQLISPQRNALDLLLHYLRTGSLPWQIAHVGPAENAALLRQTCQQQWQHLLDYMHQNSEPAAFYFRLIQLLPETEWISLVSTLFEPLPAAWNRAIGHIVSAVLASGQQGFSAYQQHQVIAALLAEGLHGWRTKRSLDSRILLDSISRQTSPAQFYSHLLQQLPETEWMPLIHDLFESSSTWGRSVVQVISALIAPEQRLFNADQQRQLVTAFLAESLHSHHDRPPNGMAILERVLGAADAQTIQAFVATLPASATLLFQAPNNDNLLPSLTPSTELAEGRSRVETNAISQLIDRSANPMPEMGIPPVWTIASANDAFPVSVHYAGLVLLHPFIPHFFTAVGVKAADETAIDPERSAHAAALLHFLATGAEEIYEYELGLIKVLLGVDPGTPLLVAAGLLQLGDQDEAETLLQSVIHYWSALKSTSIAGLRASFLQRPGLLRETEDGWHLQVEPQAFDMLLNYLPWAIGIIKFSWMPKPIYSEWLTP